MPQYETEVVNTPKPDRFKDQTSKLWSEGWDMEGMFVGQSGTMTAIFRREVKNVKPVAKKITPEPKAEPKTKKLGDGT